MENQIIHNGEQESALITEPLPKFSIDLSYPENELSCLNDKYITSLASRYEHLVVQILNVKTLQIVYASPNLEKVTGFTAQESIDGGVFKWMANLPEKELLIQLQNNQFVGSILAERKEEHALVQSFLLNGETTKKNKEKIRILSCNFTLDWTEEGEQQHHLFLWVDATHIFRTKNADLFSSREREIVFLLSQGKNKEEIGELLHIKSTAVNLHIKTMIRRLQVKDARGLLEIARWLRLI